MKRILLFLLIAISFLNESCIKEESETCTSGFSGSLKIDGEKGEKISIEYIGPENEKRNYKKEFGYSFNLLENELPYYKPFGASTICQTHDFERNNYDFLRITNKGSKDIYICATVDGPELNKICYSYSDFTNYSSLFRVYNKQDQDPAYDYTKDKEFKNVKYIDRYQLYEQLLKEKYPYIIKLPPQKTCIMKWGGLGFEII